jgi:hypothetical protein
MYCAVCSGMIRSVKRELCAVILKPAPSRPRLGDIWIPHSGACPHERPRLAAQICGTYLVLERSINSPKRDIIRQILSTTSCRLQAHSSSTAPGFVPCSANFRPSSFSSRTKHIPSLMKQAVFVPERNELFITSNRIKIQHRRAASVYS